MLFEELKKFHSKNIVHRDIKPENIIVDFIFRPGITNIREVKNAGDILDIKSVTIIDFGLAKDSAKDDVGMRLGSPKYASVECYHGAGTIDKTDNDAMARSIWYLWGSYYLSSKPPMIPRRGITFFLQLQNQIPNLFKHLPLAFAELHPDDKKTINDVLVSYHHPDKLKRPSEDAAIKLFASLEEKYKPKAQAAPIAIKP